MDSNGQIKSGALAPGSVGISELREQSITGTKLRDNSIGLNHLGFVNTNQGNLFNGIYTDGWLASTNAIGHPDGDVILRMVANGSTIGRTAVIPAKPNTTYTYRVSSNADVTRLATISGEPDFSSQELEEKYWVDNTILRTQTERNYTFTTNSRAKYVLLNVSQKGNEPDLTFVEGTSLVNTAPKNRIPKEYLDLGGGLHSLSFESGSVRSVGEEYRPNATSVILLKKIPLSKGFVVGLHDFSTYWITLCRWRKDGSFISNSPWSTTEPIVADGNYDYQIIVRRHDGATIWKEELPEIESLIYIEGGVGNASTRKRYYLTDEIDYEYELLFTPEYGGDSKHQNVQYSKVISDYDATILNSDKNDSYVTKHNYGTSGTGQTLHYYHYKPGMHDVDSGSTGVVAKAPDVPKVILITGMHGNEKSPVFGTYALMHMITNHFNDNGLYDYYRRNIEFIHVPVANPDGFNANIRRTSENIDPNTDWGTSIWYHQSTGPARNHPDGPWSQSETRALRDLVMDHQDAVLVVDFHNMFPNAGYMAYTTALDEDVQKTSLRGMMKGTREVQKILDYLPQNPNHKFSYVQTSGRGVSTRWFHEQGFPAITLETIRRNEWQSGSTYHDYDTSTIQISTTVLAEVLKSHIKMLR